MGFHLWVLQVLYLELKYLKSSYSVYLYFEFRILLGWNAKIFHEKMLNNEEIVPFPHYLVVHQCNIDRLEWISKILMVYGWMECY